MNKNQVCDIMNRNLNNKPVLPEETLEVYRMALESVTLREDNQKFKQDYDETAKEAIVLCKQIDALKKVYDRVMPFFDFMGNVKVRSDDLGRAFKDVARELYNAKPPECCQGTPTDSPDSPELLSNDKENTDGCCGNGCCH